MKQDTLLAEAQEARDKLVEEIGELDDEVLTLNKPTSYSHSLDPHQSRECLTLNAPTSCSRSLDAIRLHSDHIQNQQST